MESIFLACEEGDLEKVKSYLDRGVSIESAHPESELTPLMIACYHGHIKLVQFLLDNDADKNASTNSCGMFPLMAAVNGPDMDIIKLLLKNGANENQLTKNGIPFDFELEYRGSGGFSNLLEIMEYMGKPIGGYP